MKYIKSNRRAFFNQLGLIGLPFLGAPLFSFASGRSEERSAHKILTCNIRVALESDEEKGYGWEQRKNTCMEIIADQRADIIGFQEVIQPQMDDLRRYFHAFDSFGYDGPEMDAHQSGYHGIAKNPIFFSRDRYKLLSAGQFWLSETPLIGGSISWNSARARHANWVRLKERHSGKHFRVINLHLDHKNQQAREKQIDLVMKEAGQYPEAFPQMLTGDFNASAKNAVYQAITDADWRDSYTEIHGDQEPGYTVHLFQGENYPKKDKGRKIDFIFTKGPVNSLEASIIKDHKNGQYPSDHYFVSALLKL